MFADSKNGSMMKRTSKISVTATSLAALVSMGVIAATADVHANDASAVTQAKVSLVEAIGAAESHVNGKAARAEYESSGKPGAWVYDIEVVAASKVFDVKVDATSGAVLSSSEDSAENDDRHDKTE